MNLISSALKQIVIVYFLKTYMYLLQLIFFNMENRSELRWFVSICLFCNSTFHQNIRVLMFRNMILNAVQTSV